MRVATFVLAVLLSVSAAAQLDRARLEEVYVYAEKREARIADAGCAT